MINDRFCSVLFFPRRPHWTNNRRGTGRSKDCCSIITTLAHVSHNPDFGWVGSKHSFLASLPNNYKHILDSCNLWWKEVWQFMYVCSATTQNKQQRITLETPQKILCKLAKSSNLVENPPSVVHGDMKQ
jgi:hypothetical protein